MDDSLFIKIKKLIDQKLTEKLEIKNYILEKTKIKIEEQQIEIKGKKVKLYLSSNQKLVFLKNKGKEFLEEKGYTL